MNEQAIENYLSSPHHFSMDEWKSMEKARKELEDYKDAVVQMDSETPTKAPRVKKPKVVKDWIVG
jgi:hypothetical protein